MTTLNRGEDNLSSYSNDPNGNPLLLNTSSTTKNLSVDAIDKKTATTGEVLSSLRSSSQGRGTGFDKNEILFLV